MHGRSPHSSEGTVRSGDIINGGGGGGGALATDLIQCRLVKEAKALLRKMTPIARRVLGDTHELTLKMRAVYGQTFYIDDSATLDDLREAVTTLEDVERVARRVMGGAHPATVRIERALGRSREELRAREETA